MGTAVTFIVPGQEQARLYAAEFAPPAGLPLSRVKHSVRIGSLRGGTGETRITAETGKDIVALHIANGPILLLHPESARDLMLAQGTQKRRGPSDQGAAEVRVPTQLTWRGLEQNVVLQPGAKRASLGEVVLSAVEIITNLGMKEAAKVAAEKIAAQIDEQSSQQGLHQLAAFPRDPAEFNEHEEQADARAHLVLLHGTFSSTQGTFGKFLNGQSSRAEVLFRNYQHVWGFDHATLGKSPIENALQLAQALTSKLPSNARLHLLTHSRGGLVAEVLARLCSKPHVTAEDLKLFSNSERDQDALRALAEEVGKKNLQVERIVRVACPARGTLLASRRLDAYLSVFNWTLELAGLAVIPGLIDFLKQIALERHENLDAFAGLAAQLPESALIKWMHAVDEPVAGELRVVAGDMMGDSVMSWLKTLLADAFYWTDNDLVVQTRSMYGGAPRQVNALFLLEQSSKISHFSYFSSERPLDAIVRALTAPVPEGFNTIGPLSWSGRTSDGVRGVRLRSPDAPPAENRPAVIFLPGLLGSNLKVNGRRVWLGWRILNGLGHLKLRPEHEDAVEPDGMLGSVYDDLAEYLADSHQVIEFDYDWRLPIEATARLLAQQVERALTVRERTGQPVRLLAHSMGGIVARVMQIECPEVWDRMMARSGARLLMLGTPNRGSWAPMQVLSGDDTFGNTLIAMGAPFQDHAARKMIANFPGFIQLQAGLLDGTHELHLEETWERIARDDLQRVRDYNWWHKGEDQLTSYEWGTPSQKVLDLAIGLQRRLDAQQKKELDRFRDQLIMVVGEAPFTPDGFETGEEGLAYLNASGQGDGRVTWENAMLPGVRAWKAACEHGKLPAHKVAFRAYEQLLEHGDTEELPRLASDTSFQRGVLSAKKAATHVRTRPGRLLNGTPPERIADAVSLHLAFALQNAQGNSLRSTLRVSVLNGNLKFVRQPLLIGHYRSVTLTGSEEVMDGLIGGQLKNALRIGHYPNAPGMQKVFINTRFTSGNPVQLPRPEAVIVVGLGQEGKLRATDLIHTVRQGVIAWAQRMAELSDGAPAWFDLAATLVGSGGTGITAGQAAQLVAAGVREANERLTQIGWPYVGHLQFVELYLDRATDAWRALGALASARPADYAVSENISVTEGSLRRPLDSSYRGATYDLISAVMQPDEQGHSVIAYTLDTRRARTEVRAQKTQGALLRDLIKSASNELDTMPDIGRTLFQLLIPVEMEPFLGGASEMQIELDSGTAGIPWELLDTSNGNREGGDLRPWAIRTKLLRRLRTADFRAQPFDAERESHVLIIGEPKCDEQHYPRLAGARAEARAVARLLATPGNLKPGMVKALISDDGASGSAVDAPTVITALLQRDWRIIHIAGHGEAPDWAQSGASLVGQPSQGYRKARGVVLSNGTFLGPDEIRSMRIVPELVFINCCHLGGRNPGQLLHHESDLHYNRSLFAAGTAEELIKAGVRCVIVAGWAVDDVAARTFATTFYEALLSGSRFIDAVSRAREETYRHSGNTWAAYQCYGDPEWMFHRGGHTTGIASATAPAEIPSLPSPPLLVLALEAITVVRNSAKEEYEESRRKITVLENRYAGQWGGIGSVAEAFGRAWMWADDYKNAIKWFEKATFCNDASASLYCVEQLSRLQIEDAWEELQGQHESQSKKKSALPESSLNHARQRILDSISLIGRLNAGAPSMPSERSTVERAGICGSGYKRLAMIEALAKRAEAETKAIEKMKAYYSKAEELARASVAKNAYYPALNFIAADLVLQMKDRTRNEPLSINGITISSVRKSLNQRVQDDPDFWSVIGLIELRLYEGIAQNRLYEITTSLLHEYADVQSRDIDRRKWRKVRDQGKFVLEKYQAWLNGKDAANSSRGAGTESLLDAWNETQVACVLMEELSEAVVRSIEPTRDLTASWKGGRR